MLVYGYTFANVAITDSRGRTETYRVPFLVTDLQRYQMYLGLPWVDAARPRLNFAARRMLFKGSKTKDIGVFRQVAIEEAEAFD
jgi:hypothetical protein